MVGISLQDNGAFPPSARGKGLEAFRQLFRAPTLRKATPMFKKTHQTLEAVREMPGQFKALISALVVCAIASIISAMAFLMVAFNGH